MHPLARLAVIWAAVFVAIVAAKKTRLTPVLFFLFMGFVLVNTGILPEESDLSIREFAVLGIIFIMFAPGFAESTALRCGGTEPGSWRILSQVVISRDASKNGSLQLSSRSTRKCPAQAVPGTYRQVVHPAA